MKIFFAFLSIGLALIPAKAQDDSEIQWFEALFISRPGTSSEGEKTQLNNERIEAAKNFEAKGEAEAMIKLAALHLVQLKEPGEAMNWLIQSLALEDSMNLPQEKVLTCIAIARVFEAVGDYTKSAEFLDQAQAANKEDDYRLLTLISSETGRINDQLGEVDKAVADYEEMLKYARNVESRDKESDAQFHLGTLLTKKKEYQRALEIHKEALAIRRAIRNRAKEAQSLNEIGSLYLAMNNPERAMANLVVAIKIRMDLKDHQGLAESYNNTGALYISKKDYRKAIDNLELALSNSEEAQSPAHAIRSHELLSKCYKELGEFKRALQHQEELASLAELIQQEKNARQLLETQNRYLIRLKESEINKLEIDRHQRDEVIETQNQLQNVLYLAIGLVTIIGLLVLFMYFQKRRSNQKLKEINETKDKLFSIIGHDLKGPLNSLTAFSSLLIHQAEVLTKEEIKMLSGDVDKSLKNLFGLLENLLEWARSQTGTIDFKAEPFDISIVLRENQDLLKALAEKKNITITNESAMGIKVKAHRHSINTVVRNLISNAIKFTPAGGKITLKAAPHDKLIKVTITDTGVGMSEDVVKKLFKVGEKISTLGTSQEKGTGLGLILCKDFIEKNGGVIGVETVQDEGSKFYFTVPTA